MPKKTIYLFLLTFFITSCADTFDSVKRGVTGAKKSSSDEFLVQKKDPLVLPPNYKNLPTPDDQELATKETSSFEKKLEIKVEEDISSSTSGTVEDSILKKIQSR